MALVLPKLTIPIVHSALKPTVLQSSFSTASSSIPIAFVTATRASQTARIVGTAPTFPFIEVITLITRGKC